MNATAVSQKLTLFMRGNAMSGAPIISGTNQLPKPPIIAGITMKNTMIRPCAVIMTFQKCLPCTSPAAGSKNCAQPVRYWMPGSASSQRIRPEITPPTMPAMIAKIR